MSHSLLIHSGSELAQSLNGAQWNLKRSQGISRARILVNRIGHDENGGYSGTEGHQRPTKRARRRGNLGVCQYWPNRARFIVLYISQMSVSGYGNTNFPDIPKLPGQHTAFRSHLHRQDVRSTSGLSFAFRGMDGTSLHALKRGERPDDSSTKCNSPRPGRPDYLRVISRRFTQIIRVVC